MRIDSSSRRALLTYCTNVHAVDDVAQLVTTLDETTANVARQVARDAPFGLGLRLGAAEAADLRGDPRSLARLEETFARRNLFPFTINGFPQGRFHAARVKESVYEPDWTSPERTSYTMDLAHLLARWLPADDPFGTISTLPVGWRAKVADRLDAAAHELIGLARQLAQLEADTGAWIMVCLEPEPGCAVETISEAATFFQHHLLGRMSKSVVLRHLGVCWDACHQAVMFEDPEAGLAALDRAGVAVGKVQISNALSIDCSKRDEVEALLACDEERFLHQVSVRSPGAPALARYTDLPDLRDASCGGSLTRAGEARCHFHVPIYAESFPPLRTTRAELLRTLAALLRSSDVRHFEVETYTFHVLPEALRGQPIDAHLVRELGFARSVLLETG